MKKDSFKLNLMSKRKIEHAKIFGDFFGEGNVNELEDALVGILHDYTHIKEVMEDYDFYHYLVILIKTVY